MEYLTELEVKAKFYLELIRRIDSILAGPVRTLIRITDEYIDEIEDSKQADRRDNKNQREERIGFPVWMSEDVQPEPGDDLFSKSLCFAALQEIAKFQRRFSWLSSSDIKLLRKLLRPKPMAKKSDEDQQPNPNCLIENLLPPPGDFLEYVKSLTSKTFGALNPLTASQVFQVLLNDSEAQAHGGVGFLAFFAMIWPLHRRFPDPQRFGASIEPWEPKAYVTAKCILPIKTLQDICTERAVLLKDIASILEELKKSTDTEEYNPHQHWLFNAELDNLSARLLRLSSIVVAKKALRKHADRVREISDGLSQNSDKSIADSYTEVLNAVGDAIKDIGAGGIGVFTEARAVVREIKAEIVNRLKGTPEKDHTYKAPNKEDLDYLDDEKKIGLKFAREYTEHRDTEVRTAYFEDLYDAALASHRFLENALNILDDACRSCSNVKIDLKSIIDKAIELADANKQVAKEMDKLVKQATVWCRTVADREIAHASAQNLTDFDPSELVSAIAVAVKWNQMTTTLQVSDAVNKALAGMRADGSWSPGQPFYSPNNAVGIWPVTSDVVLTLTNALDEYRDVEVADAALFRYVDWLELTRTELNFPARSNVSNKSDRTNDQPAVGWASDRLRHRRKIHFPTTAFSVNALLKIRDLVEYRLWQLCEKRFTVITSRDHSGLKKVAPVDLGAQHLHRLHRHLAWIAETQRSDYENAEYSLVLHGPPGSSKTFVAKALSVEMWKATRPWGSKEGPRLVRITPADFTRMGEDRLDSEARLIFDLISGVRGVTIFFDEIDDLLRQRNTDTGPTAPKPTFMELVVPAMLNRLADLRDACPRQEICFLLATNFVESIEPALIRKGRIDRSLPVVYPDQESRLAMIINFTSELKSILEGDLKFEKTEASKLISKYCNRFASKLAGWPYLTIESACRRVVQNLKNTLKEKTSGQKSELSLNEKREKFLSISIKSIRQVIAEYSPSVSMPRYDARLVPPFRQELLDEYAHFIVADCRDVKDIEKWMNEYYPTGKFKKGLSESEQRESLKRLERAKALCEKINTVLNKENRWAENREIGEMLLKFIKQEDPSDTQRGRRSRPKGRRTRTQKQSAKKRSAIAKKATKAR
jgi:SpoVK/Ycf46/Vps4 family AAA+-type ATPase